MKEHQAPAGAQTEQQRRDAESAAAQSRINQARDKANKKQQGEQNASGAQPEQSEQTRQHGAKEEE